MAVEVAFHDAKLVYLEKDSKYGSMWEHFSLISLLDIAQAKVKRATLAVERRETEEAKEETLDAINYLAFAYKKLLES